MESNLVDEFIAQTGTNSSVAYTFLQAKNWDLNLALQTFLYLSNSAAVTPGTRWTIPSSVAEENGNVGEPKNSFSRPILQKADAVDVCEFKKLTRGISRATDNVNLVSRARSDIALDFRENTVYNVNQYFIETPIFTFTLPDLTIYPEDFRGFLEKDLIEMSSLVSLEQAGRLNWWADSGVCQRLWPLATTGDGNCLLHAASLGMWGFHDRLLTLRKALHGFMTGSECRDALWRRWRWQQTQLNTEAGFVYSEDEWQREWDSIVNMASTEPRKPQGGRRRSMIFEKNFDEIPENATYESLEEVHVLALAHVLRRPIVVIADVMLKDVNGEDLAPIPFGGIYLPLECSPRECRRSPLVLTYDAGHFSSLVVMEKEMLVDKAPQPSAVIPLTDSNHELLPIQFSVDPGDLFVWGRDDNNPHITQKLVLATRDKHGLIREYLDVTKVFISSSPGLEDTLDLLHPDLDPENINFHVTDEDEIEKKFTELLDSEGGEENGLSSETGLFSTNKSKAAKQLQSVAKQFGSIGKSMSKKLKKNLGSITKMTRSNSQKKSNGAGSYLPTSPVRQTTKMNMLMSQSQDYILAAVLHTEQRHEYQEEMIRNYLQSARARFQRDKELKQRQAEERRQKEETKLKELARVEGPSRCINPGCEQFGTALSSYMCKACFEKQCDEELSNNVNSPTLSRAAVNNNLNDSVGAPRYGTGKSRFYAESDPNSHHVISRMPMSRAGTNTDHTLYLSKSTFYNDSKPSLLELGPYIHELSPAQGKRDQPGSGSNKLGGRYSYNEAQGPRLHSYNLASWEPASSVAVRPLGRAGSQQEFHQGYVNQGAVDKVLLKSSTSSGSLATTTAPRNVSVATLSPQLSNDLPNVERVERQASESSSASSLRLSQPCRTNNCKFFGNVESDFYCSKCFKELPQPSVGIKSLRVQEMKR